MNRLLFLCKEQMVFVFILLTLNGMVLAQSVSSSDSLVLVSLYNSTNGPSWSSTDNWLAGPVSSWYGITIENGRVTAIRLSSNNLQGPLPSEIGNLSELRTLNIRRNFSMGGNIPPEIGNLNNLQELELNACHLTGTIPPEIGNLTNLSYLSLSSNLLTGTIPAQIGNLVNLQTLNLASNTLTGTIPTQIGNLINLQWLSLGTNNLAGVLPSSIGNLTKLETVSLLYNQLSGSIPYEIGNLTNLKVLNLTSNQLTGNIPAEISTLTKAENFEAANNQISGIIPPEIGNMANLVILDLSSNQLSGNIPAEIGLLYKLQYLALNDNYLSGSVPGTIGNMSALGTLRLSRNQFTGSLPSEINNIPYLSTIELTECKFDGLPVFDRQIIKSRIDAGSNKFTFEDIEPNIGAATYFVYSPQDQVGETQSIIINTGQNYNLQVFVGGNYNVYQWYKDDIILTGEQNETMVIDNTLPEDAGKYTCLITNTMATNLTLYSRPFYVSVTNESAKDSLALVALFNSTNGSGWTNNTNWLTGPLNAWFGVAMENGRVTYINLNNNNLAGTIPFEIGNLSKLVGLILYNNHLTGCIPNEIGNLSELKNLNLSSNQLTGVIPPVIGNLNQLIFLHLFSNLINGGIPAEIGNLLLLQELGLGQNQLNGSIPAVIGQLSNLRYLQLHHNQLTGNIPAQIGNLSNLQDLLLYSNQLTGVFPVEITNLSQLQTLHLVSNQLTGCIPPAIGNLSNLRHLMIGENQFTGVIPSEIGNLSNLQTLQLSGNHLTGNLPPVIGNLSNLSTLELSNNQFTGTIPHEIGNLDNLVSLYLNSNQLFGCLPAEIWGLSNLQVLVLENNQFTGSIPQAINSLVNLTYLNIRDCRFESLPSLNSLRSLNHLTIALNKLSFEDIEPNMGVASYIFAYSPQDSVGQKQSITIFKGDCYSISVAVGGANNHYQWYKNGAIIPGANLTNYSITNASISNAGVYECQITNSIATELTLYSRPITITVIPNTMPEVTDIPGQTVEQGGTFATIHLKNYVSDAETPDENITWTYHGNSQLEVSIINHIATICKPFKNWNGCEKIVFSAMDDDPVYPLSGSDEACFTVTPLNAPKPGTITHPTCLVETGSVVLNCLPALGTWTLTRNPGGITITGTGTSISVSGLAGGTYSYTVTNGSGGTSPASDNFVINAQPETPTAPTVGTITQPTCDVASGSVILYGLPASGTWTVTQSTGGISYSGTGTSSTLSGLSSGTYTYRVTNEAGCVSAPSAEIVINTQPSTPSAPLIGTITQPTCDFAFGSVVLNGLPASDAWTLTSIPGGVTTTGTGISTTVTGLTAGTFSFTVANEAGCVSVLSDHVVMNDVPVIAGQNTILVDEDKTIAISVIHLLITDSDNDPSQMTLSIGSGSNYSVSGESTITPAANFNGLLTVPVTVYDGITNSAVYNVSVTVSPENDAPVIIPIPDQIIIRDLVFSEIFLDNFVDDIETSQEQITWTFEGDAEILISMVDRVVNITVPKEDWTGSDTVIFTATDNDIDNPLTATDTVVFTVKDKAVTGFPDKESLQALVYPNPAKDLVNIFFTPQNLKEETITIEIITIQGEVLSNSRRSYIGDPLVLDIHDLSAGTYFIRFITSDATRSYKFVKKL